MNELAVPTRVREAERACCLLEVEFVAQRVAVEAEYQSTQDPGRCRAEHVEPEQLDVLRPHVVTDGVDERIEPRHDHQQLVGHRNIHRSDCHHGLLASRGRVRGKPSQKMHGDTARGEVRSLNAGCVH